MRSMIDAAFPENVIAFGVPKVDALAGYIGGNTPNLWTDDEWQKLTDLSAARFWLPIYTRNIPDGHDPVAEGKFCINWLNARNAPKGVCLALDLETAVDPNYVRGFNDTLGQAGFLCLAYGSKSTLFQNPKPSGGFWVADYTGVPHLFLGSAATQWAGSAKFGGAYDPNIVADTTALWEISMPTADEIADAVINKLNSVATGSGQTSFGGTVKATLGGVQKVYNTVNPLQNDELNLTALIEALPDAVAAKIPAGTTGLTPDQVKQAVKDALREGVGSVI